MMALHVVCLCLWHRMKKSQHTTDDEVSSAVAVLVCVRIKLGEQCSPVVMVFK